MTVLWILGILAVLILLLCLTRVGAQVALENGSATVDLKIGWLHIQVFPGKEKKKKPEKNVKKAEKTGEQKAKEAMPKITIADIKDAVRTLWPPLKRALDRTRRGIRVHPLEIGVTLGGAEDPAGTAELYGYLHAGVWTAMPLLEKTIDIPEPYIHIGMDFDASKPSIEGRFGISVRVGTLLAVAFGIAIPALRWFLRFRKKNQQPKPVPQPAA